MFKLKFNFNSVSPAVKMKTVSMLQFRKEADAVLRRVAKGQAFVLTYRGKPVARLEPLDRDEVPADDPIYRLYELASPTAEPIDHSEIDRIVYGA
jgi:antitoxin (DNA-binding transcriptional repressor) of toxin-antitoxin stability system